MTQPIKRSSLLAGTPPTKPHFSVAMKRGDGRELFVVDPKATRATVALMDMNAVLGGAACHYGGPAAFAELMSVTHALMFSDAQKAGKPWYELYNFVNDAGHCENGLYALKAMYGFADLTFDSLKKFRSIESGLTGHGESHLFPKGVMMSNGPLGSAFPQSQGLAMADSLAGNSRVTITAISDGACMEGEAREAMAAIPGLAGKGKLAPYILIISDNNTKLSGRIDKESFSMTPTFQSLATLGWKLVTLDDGHDLQKCLSTLEEAIAFVKNHPDTPVAIHAKTIKGIGTQKTMESSSGGHGFPLKAPAELREFLKEIYDGGAYPEEFEKWIVQLESTKANPANAGEKIQNGVAKALIQAKKQNLPVVSITSDLPGSTGVASFRKEFAGDSLDVGVAESNMISTAAGFSKLGFIPVVDTFAQFGVTKGALPLTMAALSQAPMICIFSHTGFQDAADGASHQALGYIAMTSSIPHLKTITLSSSAEAEALVGEAIQKFAEAIRKNEVPDTYVFFLGRENFPAKYREGIEYSLDKTSVVWDSANGGNVDATVVAYGSMVEQAVIAAQKLEKSGKKIRVLHPACANHPEMETIVNSVKSSGGRVVFVEDHQRIGSASQIALSELALRGLSLKADLLAVKGEFGQSAYTSLELYRKHGIDADSIVKVLS